jgi:hypothetical protein
MPSADADALILMPAEDGGAMTISERQRLRCFLLLSFLSAAIAFFDYFITLITGFRLPTFSFLR